MISKEVASFTLSESMVVKERTRKEDDGRSVDDVFALVVDNLIKKGPRRPWRPRKL